jgi:hypothetical protein
MLLRVIHVHFNLETKQNILISFKKNINIFKIMELINQLDIIEQKIKKNNNLQLALLAQVDNMNTIKQKLDKLEVVPKVDIKVDIGTININGNNEIIDKLTKKIDNYHKYLNNNVRNIHKDLLVKIDAIKTDSDIKKLSGDIITENDINTIINETDNSKKIELLKNKTDNKINKITSDINESINNINKNQDIIKQTIKNKSTKCKLIQESKLPKLMDKQIIIANKCIKYHKELKIADITNKLNRDIKKRKKYTDKYVGNIMSELLVIRKKITRKNKALSTLISKL